MTDLTDYHQAKLFSIKDIEIKSALSLCFCSRDTVINLSKTSIQLEQNDKDIFEVVLCICQLLINNEMDNSINKSDIVKKVRDILEVNAITINEYVAYIESKIFQSDYGQSFQFKNFLAEFFKKKLNSKQLSILLVVLKSSLFLAFKDNVRNLCILCKRFKLSLKKPDSEWIWNDLNDIPNLDIEGFSKQIRNLLNCYYDKDSKRRNQLRNILHALDFAHLFIHSEAKKHAHKAARDPNHPDLFQKDYLNFITIQKKQSAQSKNHSSVDTEEFEYQSEVSRNFDTQVVENVLEDLNDNKEVEIAITDTKEKSSIFFGNDLIEFGGQFAFAHSSRNKSAIASNTKVLTVYDYQRLAAFLQEALLLTQDNKIKSITSILLVGLLYSFNIEKLVEQLKIYHRIVSQLKNKKKFNKEKQKITQVHIDLPITSRPETPEAVDQNIYLNKTVQHILSIQPYLRQHIFLDENIELDHINLFIKSIKDELGLVHLSLKRLESAMSVVMNHLHYDELILDYITRERTSKKSAVFYAGYDTNTIYQTLNKCHDFLGVDRKFFEKLTHDVQFRIGSLIPFNYQFTLYQLEVLRREINLETFFVDKLNVYTLYMRIIFMLLTGARPAVFSTLTLDHLDFDDQSVYLIDKQNRSQDNPRMVPICHFLKNEIITYIQFIDNVQKYHLMNATDNYSYKLKNSQATLFHYLHESKSGFTFTKNIPEHINQSKLELFPSQDNWPRHLLRNFLSDCSVSEFLIDAIFGHELPFFEALHPFSSLSHNQIQDTVIFIDQLVAKLNLQALPLKKLLDNKDARVTRYI